MSGWDAIDVREPLPYWYVVPHADDARKGKGIVVLVRGTQEYVQWLEDVKYNSADHQAQTAGIVNPMDANAYPMRCTIGEMGELAMAQYLNRTGHKVIVAPSRTSKWDMEIDGSKYGVKTMTSNYITYQKPYFTVPQMYPKAYDIPQIVMDVQFSCSRESLPSYPQGVDQVVFYGIIPAGFDVTPYGAEHYAVRASNKIGIHLINDILYPKK